VSSRTSEITAKPNIGHLTIAIEKKRLFSSRKTTNLSVRLSQYKRLSVIISNIYVEEIKVEKLLFCFYCCQNIPVNSILLHLGRLTEVLKLK